MGKLFKLKTIDCADKIPAIITERITNMSINEKFNGCLRKSSVNPRYFTDDSGKAIYLTGSHTWAVMQDIWLEGNPRKNMDYDGFLQTMSELGHNFLRFWQWAQTKNCPWNDISTLFDPMPYERTGPGNAFDGSPKFNLNKWNEEYFIRLRERVQKASEKGIYVSIMFFEAWGIKYSNYHPDQDPWLCYPMNPLNNINNITDNPVLENGQALDFFSLNCPQLLELQKEFIKKVIDTVNDFDCVLYEICNEIPNRIEAMKWQDHLCEFVKEYEKSMPKQHPVGITGEGGEQDMSQLYDTCADWISTGNGRMFEYRYNPPASDGEKIILSDTDHLWGHGGDYVWVWKSFTRGINTLFMDPWEPLPAREKDWIVNGTSKNSRYYYPYDLIRRNLGYVRKFAEKMDLNTCIPHNELCTSTFCIANKGKEYLFLLPAGGTEGIDLWEAEGEFKALWFKPETGETFEENSFKGGDKYMITSPFSGTAVLYLWKE